MNRRSVICLLLLIASLAALLVSCSRNPAVAKLKYLESGRRYAEKGKYPEAVIQFRNALQMDAGYAAAHYQLAQVYMKLQQWTPAYNELSRTVELQPENYPAHIDLANLLIAGHEFRQAQGEADLLLQKQSDNPAAHVAAANLFAAQEDFAPATQELKKAIALAPGRWEPYENLAALQMRMNQPELAEENFIKATEMNPKASAPLLALASYYQAQSRFPEAEQGIQRAIAADPNNFDARADLVRLFMSEGKKSEAEQFAKRVSHDFPRDSAAYRMLGDFYFAVGNFDGAIAEYGALYREHPHDIQVKKNYVQLLIIKDRLNEAEKLDSEILKGNPNDVEGLIDRGQIELREGNTKASTNTLQTALRDDPTNGLAYYHLGVALDSMGNSPEAENAWQSAVRFRPDLSEAHLALAKAALREGDMPALQQSADQVIRLQPASPDGYAMRAFSYISRGQFERAEQDAAQAITVAPQSPIGYLQMGNLNLARKRYADAEAQYRLALDRDPKSIDALTGVMNTYLAQNQREKAFSVVEAQTSKNPDNSAFYDLLGTAEFDYRKTSADVDAAESNLRKSAELDKNNADAWAKLGQVQAAKGATEDALVTVQRALQLSPRVTALYVLDGRLHESKQDWQEAKDCYQKALEIEPGQPAAANNLATLLARTGGNLDLALSLAQTAQRGMPDSANAADTLGWVLYEKGAYRSAIDSFQQALKLAAKSKSPESPAVHFHLGMAYEKTGEVALARQQLKRVLKIDPNYSGTDDVKKLLERLRG